jgi:uncharacterized protein (DUF885 family)
MPGLSLTQQLLEGTAYAEAWSQYSERLFARRCGNPFNSVDMQYDHAFTIVFYALLFYLSIRVNYFGDSFITAYQTFTDYFSVPQDTFMDAYYDTYIVGNPFYGMPYAYGYARLVELHDNAKAAMGTKYNQKAFDAQYLSYGPSYFNLLADRLEQWAAAQ